MNLSESKYAASYARELKKNFSEAEYAILWEAAEQAFQKLLQENPGQSEAVAKHTHISIFPAIAIYRTVAADHPEKAMQILQDGAAAVSGQAGAKYARLLKIPGMKMLFMKIFSSGVKKGFGPEAGFAHTFITDSNKTVAFNVTKCPYQFYCEKYGCPEIVPVFCKNDEYAYGNLPHIRFIRTQTLGTGGNCCDFRFER
ncbi:MAG: L-2-amino-thiazoline-4-carboxylic acid hydrolase [Bacteroidales bacterium]|nr:L-2-amino-thiazoline-4-carboxylic acid hydrolase [Bacteroidales bacterium]MCM1424652.1 L-2-amino-thiazoline-4-carboxylic acid hydrolase [bacterium]